MLANKLILLANKLTLLAKKLVLRAKKPVFLPCFVGMLKIIGAFAPLKENLEGFFTGASWFAAHSANDGY
ncbi:MAG: hypothetical protein LBD13_00390 [Spirochaetaceae bacterium]|nr:hypothetical protein [Spirochaetaceae bacterium]